MIFVHGGLRNDTTICSWVTEWMQTMTMDSSPSSNADQVSSHVKIIWQLYLVNSAFGIPCTMIVGVILAYRWRGNDENHPMAGHYRTQVKLFWTFLILAFIGLSFLISGNIIMQTIGALILLSTVVYFLVISIIGVVKAGAQTPW